MRKHSFETKMEAVRRRFNNHESTKSISASMSIGETTIRNWCRNYESMGTDGLLKGKNKKYSLELKMAAIRFYLDRQGSLNDTCKKFKILDSKELRDWIKRYNSHDLKASPGGKVKMVMTKGRKTTLKERIDIVTDCIGNGLTYADAAEKYSVSYQQVYNWVKKYKANGPDGLADKRGRTKPEEEFTEVEKLKAENKLLKAQLKRKELENLFLKKLDEIERRRS